MRRYSALVAMLLFAAVATAGRPAGPPVLLKAEDLPVAVESAVLQKQFDALSAMPSVQVEYSIRGPVTSISGDTGVVLPGSVRQLKEGASAKVVLDAFRSVLLATGGETLTVTRNWLWLPKVRQIRAEQSIRGIPVANGRVALTFDEDTGRVQSFEAGFLPGRNLPKKAELSAEQAWQAVVRALEASADAVSGSAREIEKPTLAYFGAQPDSTRAQLVWSVRVGFECPSGRQDHELVWIDAIDGMVVARQSMVSYFRSPGPCRLDDSEEAVCETEPDASIGDAPYSSSCTGTSAKPRLIVTRIDCSNSFRVSWPRILGASQYHVLRAPTELGWAFARTVAAGYVHQCTTQVDAPNMVRMRACDGCGCGEWSETLIMDPQGECP
jgi:hypothetical protein